MQSLSKTHLPFRRNLQTGPKNVLRNSTGLSLLGLLAKIKCRNSTGLEYPKQSLKKRTKLEDSHFLVYNLLQSYRNQDSVALAQQTRTQMNTHNNRIESKIKPIHYGELIFLRFYF